MPSSESIWIMGASRSGKTTCLVHQFCQWVKQGLPLALGRATGTSLDLDLPLGDRPPSPLTTQSWSDPQIASMILVFAANGDNRIHLAEQITTATQGRYPVRSTTPLGFVQDEVILFWPLLIQELNLRAKFPVQLRPENEQELATRLWRTQLDEEIWQQVGMNEATVVRRTLDLFQLAALSGTPTEDISDILEQGLGKEMQQIPLLWNYLDQILLGWRHWCLERGFLTYGLMSELFWRYLLPNTTYQKHLQSRYRAVLADDMDDYPAIARNLFDLLLDQGAVGAFTYNPEGSVRLGLGADPSYLAGLAARCQIKTLQHRPVNCLGDTFQILDVAWITDPLALSELPESIQSIQTISRSQLLRQTAETILDAIQTGQVEPQDIAVIGPGLDAIARYTLTQILTTKGIAVDPLNEQRPLANSPMIRALLTLLALVYPGMGRLVERDAVAEMLVVLSQKPGNPLVIDPVRAGLIADHCFNPHPDQPQLLPVTAFPRWDRLGYQATTAYEAILQWLEVQKLQQSQRLIPNAIALLDRAIQRFLWNGNHLPYDQLAALRELLETAQHYWEVDTRLRQGQSLDLLPETTVSQFIQLLRSGTVAANPYPVYSPTAHRRAVTLATVFQYRASRRAHRWQFWLDAGSSRWLTGSDALFGAPLFLRDRLGHPWTAADEMAAYEQRLQRILQDLLSRVSDRVYLCHSDLTVNGQEQMGPLLSFVTAAIPCKAQIN
ncbi:MAG: recombinase family protein [Leptolyngbyaceae bacterium]|nr:recombinase family protein [Leptolyngbyaceae bacterium]